ncbi:MAG: hypothetical protein QGH32_06175 [Alphaproteobacteria bacterium]|jgi:hypothetical protein|nr:hypothetical protein [Alphaproteobacteria bacterium]|tara:strand:- start:56 stop:529 length:474 start_codon:yes stop_codon:yes gene_type:complete
MKSKNEITIEQLNLSCRHVDEMMAAGVTENFAIRILELFTDVYGKLHKGGSATPHHVDQVELWSAEAKKVREFTPNAEPNDHFVVEHGTPKRGFARMTMDLYRRGELNEKTMIQLVEDYWKLAVITIEENKRLNKLARSKVFKTPDERWAAAGIKFP